MRRASSRLGCFNGHHGSREKTFVDELEISRRRAAARPGDRAQRIGQETISVFRDLAGRLARAGALVCAARVFPIRHERCDARIDPQPVCLHVSVFSSPRVSFLFRARDLSNPFAGQLLLLRRRARFIECHPARYSGFHRRETRIGFSGMSNGRGAA